MAHFKKDWIQLYREPTPPQSESSLGRHYCSYCFSAPFVEIVQIAFCCFSPAAEFVLPKDDTKMEQKEKQNL